VVQAALQIAVRRQPGQHHPVGVGQDDADRLAVQLLVQLPENRVGGAGQRALHVRVVQVAQVDVIGGHVPLPGPPPRREDRFAHDGGIDRLGGQEVVSGLGQPVF
jgi:hypothetical protein